MTVGELMARSERNVKRVGLGSQDRVRRYMAYKLHQLLLKTDELFIFDEVTT